MSQDGLGIVGLQLHHPSPRSLSGPGVFKLLVGIGQPNIRLDLPRVVQQNLGEGFQSLFQFSPSQQCFGLLQWCGLGFNRWLDQKLCSRGCLFGASCPSCR